MTTVFAWVGFGAIVLVVGIVLLTIFVVVGKIQLPWVRRNWAQEELAEMAKHLCKHRWTLTGAQYHPARRGRFEAWGLFGQQMIDEFLYGATVASYQCDHCKIHRTHRFIGRLTLAELRWKNAA